MRGFALAALLAVAGCGVDGPPVAPVDSLAPGLTVTGEARIGMVSAL